MFKQNILNFSLCLCLHWEELDSIFFTCPYQVFTHTDKIPPDPPLIQAKQSLLLICSFFYDRCSNPIIFLMVFHWIFSIVSISFSHWEARTRFSTLDEALPELRGRIVSLDISVTLFPMRSRILLAASAVRIYCSLRVSVLSSRACRFFL